MISILKRYRALPLTALAFLMCASRAWGDWPAIAPEDLKMTDLPQQKGAPAVVLSVGVDRETQPLEVTPAKRRLWRRPGSAVGEPQARFCGRDDPKA